MLLCSLFNKQLFLRRLQDWCRSSSFTRNLNKMLNNAEYINPQTKNEIMAKTSADPTNSSNIIHEGNRSYFSVISDESADISGKELLILTISRWKGSLWKFYCFRKAFLMQKQLQIRFQIAWTFWVHTWKKLLVKVRWSINHIAGYVSQWCSEKGLELFAFQPRLFIVLPTASIWQLRSR